VCSSDLWPCLALVPACSRVTGNYLPHCRSWSRWSLRSTAGLFAGVQATGLAHSAHSPVSHGRGGLRSGPSILRVQDGVSSGRLHSFTCSLLADFPTPF